MSAVILVPVLGLFWLDDQAHFGRPGLWLLPLAAVLCAAACAELLAMFAPQAGQPSRLVVLAGALLTTLSPAAPMLWRSYPADCPLGRFGWTVLALTSGLVLALAVETWRFQAPGQSVVRVALAMLVIAYVGLLLGFLLHLRLLYADRRGLLALFSLVLVVKLADTGAYFTGKTCGRHKLAPWISPGKTVEGLVGGILAACLASWLALCVLAPRAWETWRPVPAWAWISYGATLTLAGLVGDLAESLLKRDTGHKDSGRWLPGLGGALDILDSALVAAPVGYLWWASGMLGG